MRLITTLKLLEDKLKIYSNQESYNQAEPNAIEEYSATVVQFTKALHEYLEVKDSDTASSSGEDTRRNLSDSTTTTNQLDTLTDGCDDK